MNTWKEPRLRVFSVLFAVFIALTMFSRNYLGVHTPQDVCVGLAVSVLSLFFTARLFRYLDAHPEKEDRLFLAGFVFCCLALVYITLKPYPLDYTAAGKILVDPQKMMNDGYGDIGKAAGFIIGRYVEKTWVRFEAAGGGTKRLLLCLLGLVLMVLLKSYFRPVMTKAFGSHWGKLFFSIIYTFYYIALFPVVLKIYDRKK